MKDTLRELAKKPTDAKLTTQELACALYEGTQHVQNLAEKLARTHGKAEALPFYDMASADVQEFWQNIAGQLIDHAAKRYP